MRKAFCTGALLLALVASPALAQAPFYQGKQVKIIVGFSPGGGTDLYGRIIADGLARHLEGKPSVVVQHMPGAGSVIAMNNYANRVPRDGSTLIIGTGQLLMRILIGVDGARAKISDFQALVATPMGRITYASPSAGIRSAKDILAPREPLILGVPEVISTIDAVLGLTVLKAPFR
jgi:tripartite-type tricarboxylate transporter receptor subunit TctC